MIEFVCDVWYNNDIISKELIYESFRVIAISNNLFTAWKKMEDEQQIIENDLEVDYSYEENLVTEEEERPYLFVV